MRLAPPEEAGDEPEPVQLAEVAEVGAVPDPAAGDDRLALALVAVEMPAENEQAVAEPVSANAPRMTIWGAS